MARATRKSHTKKPKGNRILVVEEQPLASELLKNLLRRYDHLSRASSGKEALAQIKHKAPDLILLDLNLPDMNGLEVARFVRRNEKPSYTPILAMSGNPMDKRNCLETGCNDFIHKPLSISTLLVRLSALVPSRSRRKKCPVVVNQHLCGLPLFRTGTLDEALRPSFDVYKCAKEHQTYHLVKTKPSNGQGKRKLEL